MNYSVITVCRNSAATIRRTIRSVFQQAIAPIEYVFVIAPSSDGTAEAIADEVSGHSGKGIRVKVVHESASRGIAPAWNTGIQETSGQYVCILNSDDWYESDMCIRLSESLRMRPNVGIVAGRANMVTPEGLLRKNIRPRPLWQFPFLMPIIHPAAVVARAVYDKMGLYNGVYNIASDYDFMYRCFRARIEFGFPNVTFTNIQLGGLAGRSRGIARLETKNIALQHSAPRWAAEAAYFARVISGR